MNGFLIMLGLFLMIIGITVNKEDRQWDEEYEAEVEELTSEQLAIMEEEEGAVLNTWGPLAGVVAIVVTVFYFIRGVVTFASGLAAVVVGLGVV